MRSPVAKWPGRARTGGGSRREGGDNRRGGRRGIADHAFVLEVVDAAGGVHDAVDLGEAEGVPQEPLLERRQLPQPPPLPRVCDGGERGGGGAGGRG